jgi:hypothetical protein
LDRPSVNIVLALRLRRLLQCGVVKKTTPFLYHIGVIRPHCSSSKVLWISPMLCVLPAVLVAPQQQQQQ